MSTRRHSVAERAASPAAFVDDYLLYLLARASAQASRQFHAIVKANGLSVPEWRVLGALAGGPRTVGTLADMTQLKQPTLTKLLDRMTSAELVQRRGDHGDRRRVYVSITARSRRIAHRLIALARKHEAAILVGYGADEAANLKQALAKLIEKTSRGNLPDKTTTGIRVMPRAT